MPGWARNAPSGINLTNIAPSPDGQVIAFEYTDRSNGRGPNGIGLLDLRSGKLTRVPNPPGQQLADPSFSYDGRRLVVSMGPYNGYEPIQVGEVNLSTLVTTPLTTAGPTAKTAPTYQPGTGKILYVERMGSFRGLKLLDPSTRVERVVLDGEKSGFRHIVRPWFIGASEVIFQARGPSDRDLRRQTREISGSDPIAYRLHLGGLPQFFAPNAEREADNVPMNYGAFDQLSASQAGSLIAFVQVPASSPSIDGKVHRELYRFTGGRVIQLTDTQSSIVLASCNYGGSLVAFVANIRERSTLDLFIYSLKTNKITPTNLLERIKQDPAFAL